MKWSLHRATDFSAHAAAWAELHARSHRSPLLSSAFVGTLLAHFGNGHAWLARCEDGGRTMAMALIAQAGRFSWATLQPAQAPVGLWLQEDGADSVALAQELLQALPLTALVFAVTQCDPDLIARPADSMLVRTVDYADTARVKLSENFADYWSGCSKNLRTNLRKQRAKLRKAASVTRLQVSSEPAEVARAIDQYAALESAGWKASACTAVTPGGTQHRFYRCLLTACPGRVYRYWIDERLAAIDLCVEDRSQLIVLKTTYDESVRPLSPALLMREVAMERVFNGACYQRVEFYGRVMDWHRQWAHEVRTLFHLNVYRWRWLARRHAGASS